MDRLPDGVCSSSSSSSSQNSRERCLRRTMPHTWPSLTRKPASRSTVPWRTYSNSRRASRRRAGSRRGTGGFERRPPSRASPPGCRFRLHGCPANRRSERSALVAIAASPAGRARPAGRGQDGDVPPAVVVRPLVEEPVTVCPAARSPRWRPPAGRGSCGCSWSAPPQPRRGHARF
jgi:hypothetical protein